MIKRDILSTSINKTKIMPKSKLKHLTKLSVAARLLVIALALASVIGGAVVVHDA